MNSELINQYNKKNIKKFITGIISETSDDDETRLQKSMLVLFSMIMANVVPFWSLIYWYFDTGTPAIIIPLIYTALSYLSFIIYLITKRYRFYKTTQLIFPVLLPFALMTILGGFRASSAVILWSFTGPIAALFFATRRESYIYFGAFVALLAIASIQEVFGIFPSGKIDPLPENIKTLFYFLNIAAVTGSSFGLLLYFINQREKAHQLIREEQAKSEKLLLNILPMEIAKILKDEDRTIADHCESVSILFADVVGFTQLSQTMPPNELVDLLNDVFSYMDSLVDKYGLEKIKTIGDCYMVAAGLPSPRKDHAQVLTRMALEARSYISSNTFRGHQLSFRMGINSGSVVAGVIGRRKFAYDLWGDVVNIASRMESHGTKNEIQITESVYSLIQSEFNCKPLGVIQVKGKGEMPVWEVVLENKDN